MRRTRVLTNGTRSTKLQGALRSPELGFKSTDFRVPENLIFQALPKVLQCAWIPKLGQAYN